MDCRIFGHRVKTEMLDPGVFEHSFIHGHTDAQADCPDNALGMLVCLGCVLKDAVLPVATSSSLFLRLRGFAVRVAPCVKSHADQCMSWDASLRRIPS